MTYIILVSIFGYLIYYANKQISDFETYDDNKGITSCYVQISLNSLIILLLTYAQINNGILYTIGYLSESYSIVCFVLVIVWLASLRKVGDYWA